ncbi:hypothetical protein ES703_90290 [subsurface metagenome]
MERVAVKPPRVAQLHHLPGIHHRRLVRQLAGGGDVMGNEDKRRLELLFDLLEQIHDVRLRQHVQRRGRLVEDHQSRVRYQRGGDGGTLSHPAGELKGVTVQEVHWEADKLTRRPRPLRRLPLPPHQTMCQQRFGNLIPDLDHRVEGIHRRLGDEGELGPSHLPPEALLAELHQVNAIKVDLPGIGMHVAGQEPQDSLGERGLTTAGLADDHHRRFPADLKAHPIHRLKWAARAAEVEAQVVDPDKRISLHHISLNLGFMMRSRV